MLIVSIECGASPERMLARLAPSACSSPRPSEWRRSSSSASRGWLVTIARVAVLLPPAEGRHVVVVAVQEPGLAGAGLRGPVGLPALEPVRAARAASAPMWGALPSAQRPAQDVVGEAVDLEEDDAGHVGVDRAAADAAPGGATTLRYQVSSSSIASSE